MSPKFGFLYKYVCVFSSLSEFSISLGDNHNLHSNRFQLLYIYSKCTLFCICTPGLRVIVHILNVRYTVHTCICTPGLPALCEQIVWHSLRPQQLQEAVRRALLAMHGALPLGQKQVFAPEVWLHLLQAVRTLHQAVREEGQVQAGWGAPPLFRYCKVQIQHCISVLTLVNSLQQFF
jgi:hypothetical protein